jgi:DNA-binding MarR family transcriptional regulator
MSDYLNNNDQSPANNFGSKYGGSKSRQRSKEFETKVLLWLSKFKFTNHYVIAELMTMKPTSARDKLKRLELKNLVRKVPCISTREGYVYILTQQAVNYLQDTHGHQVKSAWLDVTKVRDKTTAVHDLAVQFFCAKQSADNQTSKITSEFELAEMPIVQSRKLGKLKHRPDAIIKHSENAGFNGSWAIEYESMRKSSARLHEIFTYHYLHSNLDDENQRHYWGVHYFFSRYSDLKKYEKELNKVAFSMFPERLTHQEGGSEYDENKKARERFLECFFFHEIHSEIESSFYTRTSKININF